MGAAEQKSAKRFYIGAAIIIAVIMSMIYLNFPSTFLHTVYYVRSGTVAHIVSVILFIACYGFIVKGSGIMFDEKSGGNYGLIAGGLLALAIAMSAGFNFSL